MNVRAGLALIAGLLFVASGCGPGMNGNGISPAEMDPDELPSWAQDLEEGTPPSENRYTQDASLHLVQADLTDDPEERREALEDALEFALEGIEAEPENPQSYFQAGQAYLGLGQWEEAAEMLDRAEEIHPHYRLETEFMREEAWVELFNEAAEYMQAGDDQAALERFETAHMIFQGRPDAMLNMASIHQEMGETERALEYYDQSIELMTGPRMEDQEDEFREQWEDNLEVALFNRAQINFQMERYSQAAEDYQQILDSDPDNLMALSNLAVSYMQAGDTERATELYDELLARPDLSAQEFFMIGVGFFQADEFEQAARAFEESLERVPGNRDALLNLTQTHFFADEWEEVIRAGERLVEVDSHNHGAYQFIAQAYVRLDDEPTAVEWLERMEALGFEIPDLQVQGTPDGAVVLGQLHNMTLDPGTPIEIEFTFMDGEGSEVGTERVTLEAPGEDELVSFEVPFQTDARVFGYRYEVLQPSQ